MAYKKLDMTIFNGTIKYCSGIDYHIETMYPSDCDCNDTIHRCSKVEAKINNVDITSIVDWLFYKTKEDKDFILKYCVHRILSHSPIRNSTNWDVLICNGYYGEEVGGVYLNAKTDIVSIFNQLMAKKNDLGKILFVLNNEYGYILNSLKSVTKCSIISVKPSDVYIPQQDHYRRLDKDIVAKYSNYNLPTCVCLKESNRYRLIDGYHRLFAANNANLKKIDIVVLE